MANPYIIWAVVCLAVAISLFIVEIFVPSGGLIGVLAATALVSAVVLLFLVDATVGLIGALVVLVCVPVVLALVLRLWPETPVARWLTLRAELPGHTTQSTAGAQTSPLVGKQGKAISDLRPVGVCLIDGQRLDCIAEAGVIAAGTPVRVLDADGMQIRVRAEEG